MMACPLLRKGGHNNTLITRMWANVMAAMPNIGGALCSTPQSLADASYYSAVQ